MKQVGEYLYTINESSQRVSTWKIREVNGNRYVCERRRTDRICEFVEGDPDIFETEEAAMQVIKKAKRKRNSIVAVYFLVLGFIMIAIMMIKILMGTF